MPRQVVAVGAVPDIGVGGGSGHGPGRVAAPLQTVQHRRGSSRQHYGEVLQGRFTGEHGTKAILKVLSTRARIHRHSPG